MVRLIPLALLLATAVAASTTSTGPRTTRTVYVTVTASADGVGASTMPVDAGEGGPGAPGGGGRPAGGRPPVALPAVYDGLTLSGTLSTTSELDDLEFAHPGTFSDYEGRLIFVVSDEKKYWALGGELEELIGAIDGKWGAKLTAGVPELLEGGEDLHESENAKKRAEKDHDQEAQEQRDRDKRRTDPKAAEAWRKERAQMWVDRRAAVAGDWDRIGLGEKRNLRDEL